MKIILTLLLTLFLFNSANAGTQWFNDILVTWWNDDLQTRKRAQWALALAFVSILTLMVEIYR